MQQFSAESIPPYPGAYVLQLKLRQPRTIKVGRLGERWFPAGTYLYLGSALGPGGLRARVGRHLRSGNTQPHWHIDYLRSVAEVNWCMYKIVDLEVTADERNRTKPLECAWSQALNYIPDSFIPLPGFGASDCQAGCAAHLVAFSISPQDNVLTIPDGIVPHLISALAGAANSSPDEIVFMTVQNI